nr:hypothetical protein [Tanacetum cinerariifolium]
MSYIPADSNSFVSADVISYSINQLEIHRGSLSQEDVNLKFLRSLPSEWKTHTLIWRNKDNLEEHSLDDLFNNFRIYEAKVKHSSSPGNPSQNIAFVSSSNTDSTTDSVSAANSISAVYAHLPVSSHLNIDSLSNAVIFSFFASQSTSLQIDNEDLKQINDTRRTVVTEPQRRHVPVETSTSNALVSQCDRIRSYDWIYQAEEEPANFALMAISSTSSSDNEVQSCSTACSKAYKKLHSQYDSQTVEIRKSKIDVLSYQEALESVESRLVVYKQNESIFQDNIVVLKNEVVARDNFISNLKKKLKEAEIERDDLKLKFEKFQSSSKSLAKLIASQTNNKHGLGYLPSEGVSASLSLSYPSDRVGVDHLIKDCTFHAKPKPQSTQRNSAYRGYNKQYASSTKKYPQKRIVPTAVLTKSKPVSVTAARPVSVAVPKIMATKPRHTRSLHTNPNSIIRRHKTCSKFSKTSNSSLKVDDANAKIVSVAKGKKGKWVWRPKQHILDHGSRNMSYLSDFQELNGGYVAFEGNPKGGKITGKGKIKTGKVEGKVDEGFLVGYSVNSKAFRVFNS